MEEQMLLENVLGKLVPNQAQKEIPDMTETSSSTVQNMPNSMQQHYCYK